jgi:GT2 family glycosyltransferase
VDVSVIIVSYNCKNFLDICINSVLSSFSNISGEIIIIDNNSTDGTKKFIRKFKDNIVFIQNNTNLGFARANNIGSANAKGKFLLFLNPDTIISENLIENYIKFYYSKKNIGLLSCRMVDGRGDFLPESKRNTPTKLIALKKIFNLNTGYYSELDTYEFGKVDVLCGANIFVKKNKFNELGKFNEKYFMYGEDIELSVKSKLRGYENYYLGKNSIIHFKGESNDDYFRHLKNFYGAISIYQKNMGSSSHLLNILTDVFLKFVILFKLISIPKKSTAKNIDFENIFLFSDKHYQTISDRFPKVKSIMKIEETKHESSVILDPNFLSYQEIIDLIQNNKSQTFYFLSKDSSFLINSSNKEFQANIINLT